MTEVLQLPSSSSCSRRPCGSLTPNDGSHPISLINAPPTVEDQRVEIEEEGRTNLRGRKSREYVGL